MKSNDEFVKRPAVSRVQRSGGLQWLQRQTTCAASLGCDGHVDELLAGGGVPRRAATPLAAAERFQCQQMVSGLRSGDVAVVCGPTKSGKTEYAYDVAAQHVVRSSGCVLWVTAPGSAAFRSKRCLAHIEHAVRLSTVDAAAAHLAEDDDDALAQFFACRVLTAAEKLRVAECSSIEEFEHALSGQLNHTNGGSCCFGGSTAADGGFDRRTSLGVPLLIVDGLGSSQFVALWEKLRGVGPLPMRQWVETFLFVHQAAALLLDTVYHHAVPPVHQLGSRGDVSASVVPAADPYNSFSASQLEGCVYSSYTWKQWAHSVNYEKAVATHTSNLKAVLVLSGPISSDNSRRRSTFAAAPSTASLFTATVFSVRYAAPMKPRQSFRSETTFFSAVPEGQVPLAISSSSTVCSVATVGAVCFQLLADGLHAFAPV